MMRLGSSDSTRHIGARYDVHFCYTYRHEYETKRTLETAHRHNASSQPNCDRVDCREEKSETHAHTNTHIWCVTFVRIAHASRVEQSKIQISICNDQTDD